MGTTWFLVNGDRALYMDKARLGEAGLRDGESVFERDVTPDDAVELCFRFPERAGRVARWLARYGPAKAYTEHASPTYEDPDWNGEEDSIWDYEPGDKVRIVMDCLTLTRTLDQQDCDDLNAGENIMHPWQVKRFERIWEGG